VLTAALRLDTPVAKTEALVDRRPTQYAVLTEAALQKEQLVVEICYPVDRRIRCAVLIPAVLQNGSVVVVVVVAIQPI
jgi:hypothetical protein